MQIDFPNVSYSISLMDGREGGVEGENEGGSFRDSSRFQRSKGARKIYVSAVDIEDGARCAPALDIARPLKLWTNTTAKVHNVTSQQCWL
jgi:hypothetical protein